MATPRFVSKRARFCAHGATSFFGSENTKGDILDHWIASHDSLALSAQEVYAAIEERLEARKVRSIKISHEEPAEGGLLSDMRVIYLERISQIIRELGKELTAARKIRLGQQYRHTPILGELHKPVSKRSEPKDMSVFQLGNSPAQSSTPNQ